MKIGYINIYPMIEIWRKEKGNMLFRKRERLTIVETEKTLEKLFEQRRKNILTERELKQRAKRTAQKVLTPELEKNIVSYVMRVFDFEKCVKIKVKPPLGGVRMKLNDNSRFNQIYTTWNLFIQNKFKREKSRYKIKLFFNVKVQCRMGICFYNQDGGIVFPEKMSSITTSDFDLEPEAFKLKLKLV